VGYTINTKRLILIIAVLAVALLQASSASPSSSELEAASSLGVVYADGRPPEDVPLYELEKGNEALFISTYDVARMFRATKFWSPGSRKLVLRIDGVRYLFTIDTRVVMVGDEPALMHIPVRYRDGQVMIPLEFISDILSSRLREGIELDWKRLLLTIGSPQYNVNDISFEDDESGSKAVITMTDELLYHVDSDTPGLLRIKIYGGKLNPLKFTINETHGLFNRVRAEQTESDSYLFFDVRRTVRRFKVTMEPVSPESGSLEENRVSSSNASSAVTSSSAEGEGQSESGSKGLRRLVIFLEKGTLPEIPEADFAGRKMVEITEGTGGLRNREIKRVVIDPGHGGIDKCKVSPSGIMEKDVNLAVAFMLADRLHSELGVDVVLTRKTDVLIPLEKRAEMANEAGADLFISIHCNGWFHPEAGGFETFFLAPPRTKDEERLARDENASIKYENPLMKGNDLDEVDFILWDMVQNEYINESSDFAELVQRELSARLEIRNRGVKQAGLKVLKGLKMPAVLVEMAFLSNPEEEKLLMNDNFRENVVEGIVEAIRKFQNRYAASR